MFWNPRNSVSLDAWYYFSHIFFFLQGAPTIDPNVCDEMCLIWKELACLGLHS